MRTVLLKMAVICSDDDVVVNVTCGFPINESI